jgi:pyruvate dehydrogenase E1 component beta subunit
MVLVCKQAVDELAKKGIQVELIDLRTVKPLDITTIGDSVRKTHHCVLVEEGHLFSGICAEVAFEIMEHAFDFLDAPIKRVTQCETPMPYSKILEKETLPTKEKIIFAIEDVLS